MVLASNTNMIMALEAFLWHPYSATYQPTTNDFKLNDSSIYARNPALYLVSPPRSSNIPPHFNVGQIVEHWADSMGLQVRVTNHLVICSQSRDLLLVDYILEANSEVVLLSIEYVPTGENSYEMADYMSMIKSVCMHAMGTSPRAYVLTITGTDRPSAVSRAV
jgi:hypothetical protein